MRLITGIMILGISIFSLGVFLIVAGYDSSMTSLGFGTYFVLVGGIYAVVLPILTPRIASRYIEPPPPSPVQNNTTAATSSVEPAAQRTGSTSESAELQPSFGRTNESGRSKPESGNPAGKA